MAKHGPLREPKHETLETKFWRYATPGAVDECWEWRGGMSAQGYGQLGYDAADGGRVAYTASRISYYLANGRPDLTGLVIRHSCDNRPCVNPAHLAPGTDAENAADRKQRGRTYRATGERSGRAKLTRPQVDEIRQRYSAGETRAQLARAFGVSFMNIDAIVKWKTWR